MRQRRMIFVLAVAAAFSWLSAAHAHERAGKRAGTHHRHVSLTRSYIRGIGPGGRIVYLPGGRRIWRGRGTGFVDLAGGPGIAYGFYPLPARYRLGAWRYHWRNQRPPWQNPVLFAIAADAARYNYWIPGNRDYVYGVFSPYDGVGTPFFGGWYGPSGDDEEQPPFPFGGP